MAAVCGQWVIIFLVFKVDCRTPQVSHHLRCDKPCITLRKDASCWLYFLSLGCQPCNSSTVSCQVPSVNGIFSLSLLFPLSFTCLWSCLQASHPLLQGAGELFPFPRMVRWGGNKLWSSEFSWLPRVVILSVKENVSIFKEEGFIVCRKPQM